MQLSIKTNFPQVQAALSRLQADVGRQALASALNKTIDQAKTAMSREIVSEFNVKAAYVRDRLRVRRAAFKGQLAIEAALIGGKAGGKGRSVKDKPTLKLIACHRGDAIGDAVVRRAAGERITKGPLRGCVRNGRSVFKTGAGYLLEFMVCLRVRL